MIRSRLRAEQDERASPHLGRRLWRTAVAVGIGGVAAVVVLAAVVELRARNEAGSSSGITVANYRAVAEADGGSAPSFTLPSLDGSSDISFSPSTGDVVVMNFWASWCVPCRGEAPELEAAWQRHRASAVRFVGVVYRDPAIAARSFVEELGVTYPNVVDEAGTVATDYGVIGLPTTLVIAPDGTIAFRFTGRIDEAILNRAIEDAAQSSAPEP